MRATETFYKTGSDVAGSNLQGTYAISYTKLVTVQDALVSMSFLTTTMYSHESARYEEPVSNPDTDFLTCT